MLTPDFETKILLDLAPKVAMFPQERARLEAHIRERAEMVRLGVGRCPTWFQEELNRVDSRLRAWWDAWAERWVIDRLQDEGIVEQLRRMSEDGKIDAYGEATGLLATGAYYLTILQFTPSPTLQLDRSLIDFLKRSDMQRFSAGEYLAHKRKAAEERQQQNDQQATDKVLEAVDNLSAKQLDQFIAVETAIQTGETITAHGSDAKFLERAQQERQRFLKDAEARGESPVLDNPSAALNPGMHPRRYTRRRKAHK